MEHTNPPVREYTKKTPNSGIYKIVNNHNQKLYIGQSKDIYQRWYQHLSDLRRNKHHCKSLQKDWNFYKEESFTFSVIETCDLIDLIGLEKDYIISYPKERLYNFNIENHPWKAGFTALSQDLPVRLKRDCDGDLLSVKYCPNCQLDKLSNSFDEYSIYCFSCRQEIEAEFETESEILEGTQIKRYKAPVTKYKL